MLINRGNILQAGVLFLFLFFHLNTDAQLCTGSLGDPVVNITFGSGNNPGQPLPNIVQGATTTYPFIPVFGNPATPTVFDGQYTITNNIIAHPAWFSGALDHTPNDVNGFMAFFNASESPGEFYKQTVQGLCENTKYEFAAWAANVLNPAALNGVKPDITFVVQKLDGTTLATYSSGPIAQHSSMEWEQFGFFFSTPPGVNSVVLKMINTNVGGNAQPGNDFAIDDITFRPCGPTLQASFNASTIQVTKTQCGSTAVALYGTTSGGYNAPSYQWQKSLDNGISWSDLPTSNSLNYTYTPVGAEQALFRVLSGESSNINSVSCRIASRTISLTINAQPQISISGNQICPGGQGQLQFQFSSGVPPYSVAFNNGQTNFTENGVTSNQVLNATLNGGSTTNYTITSVADAAGCIRNSGFTTASATITVLPASNSLCNSQTVTAAFTTPDTVCINTPVNITNTTTGASSYYWNFCVADINKNPTGVNMGSINGALSAPVFMDYAYYNGNYYGFVINHAPGALIRLDFGNSLLNTPTSVNLGNFGGSLPAVTGTEGIQIVFNENKWYAIIVGGNPVSGYEPRIVKLEFGTNLANPAPAATNWGNLGNMLQPIDLHVFKEGNNWYGFTVNAENNTITRFNFTNSFNNTPTAISLGNIGNLSYPTGIHAINDNNFWRVFIVNAGDNARVGTQSSITRLDFGSSMLNVPTAVNLGNPNGILKHPRDLTIMKSCDQIIGFAVNGNANANDIVKLNFNNNLSAPPTITSLGNIGNLDFPHSISKLFRVNEDIYGFVTNVANNTLTRLRFSGCNNSSIAGSALQNPSSITYNTAGTYNINLTIDDGLPTQNSVCRQVDVVNSVPHSAPKNVSICEGESIRIGTVTGLTGYIWSTGATTDSITVNSGGTYWVENARYGCANKDSIVVTVNAKPVLTVPSTVSVCPKDTVRLSASGAATYTWSPIKGLSNSSVSNPITVVDTTITYTVRGSAANGCTSTANVVITAMALPQVMASNDTSLCLNGSANLSVSGALQYQWSPSTALSNAGSFNPVARPLATTKYYVRGMGSNGCTNIDSVVVSVRPAPKFAVSPVGAAICSSSSIQLTASGGDNFSWQAASTLSGLNISNPFATPTLNTVYSVLIRDTYCNVDSLLSIPVVVNPKPVISVTADNDITCSQPFSQLRATGGNSYKWSPSTGLNNSSIYNPVATINQTTTFYVDALSDKGCTTRDSVQVKFLGGGEPAKQYMPTAFTPNGDGLNDCFGLKTLGNPGVVDFRIFSRWGELMFQSNSAANCWDGNYKGIPQQSGTFVYVIKAKSACGDIEKKGTFVLIR